MNSPELLEAKRLAPVEAGVTARAMTAEFELSRLTRSQLEPLLEDKNKPPYVPAKSVFPDPPVEGTSVSAFTLKFVNPALTGFQLVPPIVDTNTPLSLVPANITLAPELVLTAKE